ncbi:hypothetical protein [Nonomuraea sp. NPDC050691]|uniref:hypothetical protein n=1 Tax=Nonomuraea sp. NPDC050691 TaxID=3155661 RepID=UPI0033CD1664
MRRYRFGRIAALLAVLYVVVVIASGVVALVTGDSSLLVVVGRRDPDSIAPVWWAKLVVVAAGLLRGWILWQVLRGRRAGQPGRRGGAVGWLRAALYASVGLSVLDWLPIPDRGWLDLLGALVEPAVVWLWFRVLAGVIPRGWRVLALVAGMVSVAMGIVDEVVSQLDPASPPSFLAVVAYRDPIRLVWLAVVLAAQARDPRWSRATVRMGVFAGAVGILLPSRFLYAYFGSGGVDYTLLVLMVLGALGLFGLVWEARSAHELAGPAAEPSRPPAEPSRPRAVPSRAPSRSWPLVAVAVVLPLVPAVVNLAQGRPSAIGPRGVIEGFVRAFGSVTASVTWVVLDALVGVGVPAVLVLVAVVRGSRRLLRAATWILVSAAVVCAVSAVTHDPTTRADAIPTELLPDALRLYPEVLFPRGADGWPLVGISPLWFGLALAASALVLAALYGTAPVRRSRRRAVLTVLATAVTLFFVPAADQQRGTFTTAGDCAPPDPWDWDHEKPPPPTGTRAFLCEVRTGETLAYRATASDQVLLAHGRRLCGVYTRRDPAELARVRTMEKLGTADLESLLGDICPAAAAVVAAEVAAEDREIEERQAEERRKCAATPRHRPLIKPAKVPVLKDPVWPELGLEMIDELSGEETGAETTRGMVSSSPGYLSLYLSSEFHVCVTLETYTRRPPLETKGWDEVVEAGYLNTSGEMTLMDGLAGITLPDLSLGGRKGHYRVRVHFAWFPWKGEKLGIQRLLVMAYPAPGDKVVTYRGRRR